MHKKELIVNLIIVFLFSFNALAFAETINRAKLNRGKGHSIHRSELTRPSFSIASNRGEFSRPSFNLNKNTGEFSKPSFSLNQNTGEFSRPSFSLHSGS